jgi:glycosyltransferase involved in cell wall biosynthesis
MTNKTIIFYEIDIKRKSFFAHLRQIETTSYVMKRKSITRWKKLAFKSFSVVFVNYEEDHIYQMLRFNEIIYRVSFITWVKEKTINSSTFESTKKHVFETIESFAKKQVVKSIQKKFSIIIIFMSTSRIILKMSFLSFNIATSNIKSDFSTSSTRSALKRHFELRYRLDFLNSLKLSMMSCMKNVINLNQILKSRSYQKIMKNFNRDK